MIGKTDEGDEIWMATTEELLKEDEIRINTKTSNSIKFHLLHDKKKDNFLLTEQIPKEYHEFIKVLSRYSMKKKQTLFLKLKFGTTKLS